jgi:hypothetical protein
MGLLGDHAHGGLRGVRGRPDRALLVARALSDHVGRRPVLAAAIALEAVSLVLFLTAGDVACCCSPRRCSRASPPAPR